MLPDLKIIKKLRKQFGMTQKELAEAVNLKQSTISRTENGIIDPPYSKVRIIFNYFIKKNPYLFPNYSTCLNFQNNLKKCKSFTEQIQLTLKEIISLEL